jgi:hypothetical protein
VFPPETAETLADLMGVAQEVTFEGRDYPIRHPSVDEMALFGRWMERRAFESVAAAVYLPESAQDKLYASVVVQRAAGEFEYHSRAGYAAQATPTGRAKLLHLTLSHDHPEVTEEFALRMVDRCQREIAAILTTRGDPSHPKAPLILAWCRLESDYLSSSCATRLSAFLGTRSGDSPPPNSSASSASDAGKGESPTSGPTTPPGGDSSPPETFIA